MDQKERFRKNIIKYQKREVGYQLFQLKDEVTDLLDSKELFSEESPEIFRVKKHSRNRTFLNCLLQSIT